ncbi:MAG: hypothetical protein LBQ79_00575 [Deltaproteobacteria bacterium]|nr:hypothetical protein [Deltaproteobacteria bacterium]
MECRDLGHYGSDARRAKRVPQPMWEIVYSAALVSEPFGGRELGGMSCVDPFGSSRSGFSNFLTGVDSLGPQKP